MVRHTVDPVKCRGCGKCVEMCGLELWTLVDTDNGKKRAQVIEEAKDMCHMCLACRDACPEEAISITEE
jgi:NAD-dependent dihydropyrimidine dehydrogenase PreA subunit